MNPYLLGMSGPLAGQRLELPAGLSTFGREAGNTFVVADQAVSRQHARISVVSGVATLEDVGSSGGTFVNEARIGGPTLLKVGDSIRMGGTVFNFVPGASVSPTGVTATMPSRSSRKKEVGSAERANLPPASTPMATPMLDSNPGCMPDMSGFMRDLDGCLPWLLRIFIILVILLVIGAIIGGVVMLAGVAGSGLAGGAAAAGGGASGAGAGGGGGGAAGGGDQPPPQQQQQQQQQQTQPAKGTIKIVSVKTGYYPREGYHAPVPIALITWQNIGNDPVVEVFADVRSFDRSGNVIGLQHAVRIYTGRPVAANEQHTDDEKLEGVQLTLDQGKQQDLDHATVTPTEIRVQAAQSQGAASDE